ncbi:MAG: substrate-binding domain-containing protein [Solirubrobacteraceae bacterium]
MPEGRQRRPDAEGEEEDQDEGQEQEELIAVTAGPAFAGRRGSRTEQTMKTPEKGMSLRSRTRFGLMRLRPRAIAALAVAVPVLALPAAASAAKSVTLVGSGSSAAQPYMLELFKGYSALHSNVHFKYAPDGGNAGVKDVQAGRVEFAINTRPPEPSDAGTTYEKLFLDGLCIIANHSNSITNISLSDLKNVFLGIDTSWNQVAGSNLTSTIDPIGRNSAAGLYTFFQQSVLGGQTQASNVLQDTADGLVQIGVEKDPNSIGYVGLAHSIGSGERALTVNGVACNAAQIRSKTYPLFRYDWAVLPTSKPNTQVEQFLDWVRTSKAAGTIIDKAGAVAAFNA